MTSTERRGVKHLLDVPSCLLCCTRAGFSIGLRRYLTDILTVPLISDHFNSCISSDTNHPYLSSLIQSRSMTGITSKELLRQIILLKHIHCFVYKLKILIDYEGTRQAPSNVVEIRLSVCSFGFPNKSILRSFLCMQ